MQATNVTSEKEQAVRQACNELRARLRGGEVCRAETIFAAHALLADDAETALEVLYTEYVTREELGQRPSADELCARFPRWQDRLKRLLDVHAGLDVADAAGVKLDTLGEDASRDTGQFGSLAADIGAYEVLELIGRGGMGVVYKARHRTLKRLVALKRLVVGPWASAEEGRRFHIEAQTVSHLDHVNIVKLFEVGEQDGQPYLILELVQGGSLASLLDRGPLPADLAAEYVSSLARALQHAHDRGVLHRDLKPANILLQTDEGDWPTTAEDPWPKSAIPKIADFGLAKRLNASYGHSETGKLVGTPAYFAPERIDGKNDHPASDIYSLGAVLYECLTGRPPFLADSPLATLCQVRDRDPVPPADLQPDCPRDLATICLHCLHKDARRRYPTAAALADDLDHYRRGESIRVRPASVVERTFKWARRRPLVAALCTSLATVVVTALIVVTVLWQQTAQALSDTEAARRSESASRQSAELNLFAKQLMLARRAWENLQFDEAQRHLEECAPELRNEEWRALREALGANEATIPGTFKGVVFSPDGSKMALAASNAVRVLEVKTTRQLFTRPYFSHQLTFNPQGDRLIVCIRGGGPTPPGLQYLDAQTGTKLEVRPTSKDVWGLSPCGRFLISQNSSRIGGVLAEDHSSGTRIMDLSPIQQFMSVCEFSRTGDRCLTISAKLPLYNSKLEVWDTAAGKVLHAVQAENTTPLICTLSPDGKQLARCLNTDEESDVVTIQDVESGREVLRFRCLVGKTQAINLIRYSPDGRNLVACCSDHSIAFLDAQTGQELRRLRGHTQGIREIQFSPDGRRLATIGGDGLRIWRLEAGEEP